MSRTDFEAAYIERYGHRPRGWNDDFQVYQDAHANGAWFGWQAGAAGIEAKAAPVGELREAFEAWCEESGQYVKSPVVFEAFQAGAAYQRQSGVVMPESVGVLILGGLFHGGSGPELGDIDIEPDMRVLERIQMELVTSSDDVHLELFARLNGGNHE